MSNDFNLNHRISIVLSLPSVVDHWNGSKFAIDWSDELLNYANTNSINATNPGKPDSLSDKSIEQDSACPNLILTHDKVPRSNDQIRKHLDANTKDSTYLEGKISNTSSLNHFQISNTNRNVVKSGKYSTGLP